MPKIPILQPGQSYTFADYFKLNYDPEDILASFGFSLQLKALTLPQFVGQLERLANLKERIEESLPLLTLTSEVARREFLIAPVLIDLIHYTQAKLKVEYPININEQLKGSLDYYIQSQQSLLVIEAKNEDLQRGFTQLAVELIALDQWTPSQQPLLHGAVSTGIIWQFGTLERQTKQITQDLNLYRVPADLEELLSILVAILTNPFTSNSATSSH